MKEDNISDFEIQVIGGGNKKPKRYFLWWIIGLLVGIIAVISIIAWRLWPASPEVAEEPVLFEQEQNVEQPHPLQDWLMSLDTIKTVATITNEMVINDIPLRIYAPLNTVPHLETGYNIADNRDNAILFFHASDVRADNGKIVGAFVLHGKPLSWGLSKRGYCAIIENQVTIGVAENSPLFEQATEQDGDFFRQYPLVSNGQLVENELKNKANRRALCDIEGHIVVVESLSRESLHDFAQALVDIGTTNAIYLVGGEALGWSMDIDGNGTEIGNWDYPRIKNISFIVWPK